MIIRGHLFGLAFFCLTCVLGGHAQGVAIETLGLGQDYQVTLAPGRIHTLSFFLAEPNRVEIEITVENDQPVDVTFGGMELENYAAAFDSLQFFNFTQVEHYRRTGVTQYKQTLLLGYGSFAFVVSNPGPKEARLHLKNAGEFVEAKATPGAQPLVIKEPLSGLRGSACHTGRYELSIVRYTVSGKKLSGEPWDPDGSPPDVNFMLRLDPGTGISNVKRTRGTVHQDTFFYRGPLSDQWEFDWDGRGPILLVAWDRDGQGAGENGDLIGQVDLAQSFDQEARKCPLGKACGWPEEVLIELLEKDRPEAKAQGRVLVIPRWRQIKARPPCK